MKKLLVSVMGLLLIGVNAFAAGDLVVNGKLGVGTSTFTAGFTGQTTNESAMELTTEKNSNTFDRPAFMINFNGNTNSAPGTALVMNARAKNVANTTGNMGGGSFNVVMNGAGTLANANGMTNYLIFATSLGNYTISDKIDGNAINLVMGGPNTGNHNITNYYGFHSFGSAPGLGSLSGTNWRHAYFEDLPDYSGTVASVAGLWIDKQTQGTNNYGIVLNGDGAGSDIVFGTGQNVKLYANAGDLYVKDASNNVTLLGPHDPKTGEWIFYSKNIKTGKSVRVNMEKLVKAVEKLTGETFMVESLIEGN